MSKMSMRLPEAAGALSEGTSIAIAQTVQWADINLAFGSVATGYVCKGQGRPLVLLHGFDSSLFEFRRLVPLLAEQFKVYAVDLLGFGFCDRAKVCKRTGADADRVNPTDIRAHLFAFLDQVIGEPVILAGASMGGGVAIDFAVNHPEQVSQLVLLDAVGYATASGPGKLMVPPLDRWATNFLRNAWVRRKISENAYYDKSFVTPDAELCASLHLLMPYWSEALIAFTKSGGYNFLSDKISQISMPTLVLWGRQDKILGVKDAARFEADLTNGTLVWIEDCGHVPHLEQAKLTAEQMTNFLT
ncbi:MAG: alpha/beta fold hydrolase [Cyanobacteria bacterium J06598_3]